MFSKRNRLFQKFLASFLGFVLLPVMGILGMLLYHTSRLQKENADSLHEKLSAQAINAVRLQIDLAENMCKTVIQNQNILNFLDKEYDTANDLTYYSTTIRDFVKVTNGVSDIKLRIYLENSSIPMGFGIFFPLEYINRTEQFQTFYEDSDLEDIWLDGNFDNSLSGFERQGVDECYHYFLKIKVGTRLLGVMEAMVPKNVFSITDASDGSVLVPLDIGGNYIYNYTGVALPPDLIEEMEKKPAFGEKGQFIYSQNVLFNGPFSVTVVSSRGFEPTFAVTLFLLLPVFFVVMMLGFFRYNRRMIQDIHRCLDGMEHSIANNFEDASLSLLISKEMMNRGDEITSLASRIQYLIQQIRSLLNQKVQEERVAKEAQLLALQHQINPHFLYNTMEVFSSRMELAGLYEESGAISGFCRMLRYSMNTQDMLTTLGDEIRQVKYYLAIQRLRRIPFTVSFHVLPKLEQEPCIRFLLEPFMENSFKYRGTANPLQISVSIQEEGNSIAVCFENNGEPLSPERTEELNHRFRTAEPNTKSNGENIGLNNINSRLKLFYGQEHCIQVFSREGKTSFRFSIDKRPSVSETEKDRGFPL